jgi:hypothetical protein
MWMFLWQTDFISLGFISRSGIAVSHDNFIFNFLRTFCSVFHMGVVIYIPIVVCKSSLSLPPWPHLLSIFFFLIIAFLAGVRWLISHFSFDLHCPKIHMELQKKNPK